MFTLVFWSYPEFILVKGHKGTEFSQHSNHLTQHPATSHNGDSYALGDPVLCTGKSKERLSRSGGLRNISLLIKKELILALLGIITAHVWGGTTNQPA